MMGRLIFAIISTVLEEVAIVVIILWGLPQVEIQIPVWGLIIMMVVWAAYSIFTYRLGTRALIRKQLAGFPNMIGTKGEVVSPLSPDGLVRIRGELWVAKSAGGKIKSGSEVFVVGQERLKLVVRENNTTDNYEGNP
ncbi:NfeD family protein [Chloroflexota bacterium]